MPEEKDPIIEKWDSLLGGQKDLSDDDRSGIMGTVKSIVSQSRRYAESERDDLKKFGERNLERFEDPSEKYVSVTATGKGDKRDYSITPMPVMDKDAADFKIETPNAKGSVKGSDIFTYFQGGNSGMLVTEGTLLVFNPAHAETVLKIPAGNAVLVPLDGLPKGPREYLDMEKKFHEISKVIYQQAAAQQQQQGKTPPPDMGNMGGQPPKGGSDDNVVDGDYEVVD